MAPVLDALTLVDVDAVTIVAVLVAGGVDVDDALSALELNDERPSAQS